MAGANRVAWLMVMVLAGQTSAVAQAVRVSDIQVISSNLTAVNGGGFSIVSGGGLNYHGPLNEITQLDAAIGVRMVINDQVLMDGVSPRMQVHVDSGRAKMNSLSPQLVDARLEMTTENAVGMEIGGRLPMPIAIVGSIESFRSIQVDGQSWSVFPSFEPSAFKRSIVE